MYEDNLAEFHDYCDEQVDSCAICLRELPDVAAVHGFCQKCADEVAAALVLELEDQ